MNIVVADDDERGEAVRREELRQVMASSNNNATGGGGVVTVVVRRDGRGWVAEAAAFGVARARTLHTVVRLARELMAGAGSAEPIEYQFHTGDAELDRLVIQIRAARLAAQRLDARVRRLTGRVLTLPSGGSVRDLALLVGLSHQSVHLLMRKTGKEHCRS